MSCGTGLALQFGQMQEKIRYPQDDLPGEHPGFNSNANEKGKDNAN